MNGGASVFFIFLVGVLVVFGAGYLLSQSEQMATTNAVCDASNKLQAEMYATAVPQVTRAADLDKQVNDLRAQLEQSKAAQQKTEAELRVLANDLANTRASLEAEKQARAKAESSLAAEAAKRAAVEDQLAGASADLAAEKEARAKIETESGVALANYQKTLAERNAAIDVLDATNRKLEAANKENADLSAKVAAYEEQMAKNIPVNPVTGMLPDNPWAWLLIALTGTVIFFGAYFAGRGSEKSHSNGSTPHTKGVTTVVMSVEEARKYAREKRRGSNRKESGTETGLYRNREGLPDGARIRGRKP